MFPNQKAEISHSLGHLATPAVILLLLPQWNKWGQQALEGLGASQHPGVCDAAPTADSSLPRAPPLKRLGKRESRAGIEETGEGGRRRC